MASQGILALPNELCERIAELSDPHDLLALRLICHEAETKILRTYVCLHFTERAFLLCDEDSLRTLLRIAEHPIYEKTMRKVMLCADELANPTETWPGNEEFDPTTDGRSDEQRTAHAYCFGRQCDFQQREADLHLLAAIFARFRQRDNHEIEVMVTDTWFLTNQRPARGDTSLQSLTGGRLWA